MLFFGGNIYHSKIANAKNKTQPVSECNTIRNILIFTQKHQVKQIE